MLQGILIGLQILVLACIGYVLWQIWHKLPNEEEAPLDEKGVKQFQRSLKVLAVLAGLEAALAIACAIVRFVETLS